MEKSPDISPFFLLEFVSPNDFLEGGLLEGFPHPTRRSGRGVPRSKHLYQGFTKKGDLHSGHLRVQMLEGQGLAGDDFFPV